MLIRIKQIHFYWLFLLTYAALLMASFCGDNKIPFGIEIYKDGHPTLLCSKPSCYDKTFAECDERAVRNACHSKNGWVGGIDKSSGLRQPLYVQCCELDGFEKLSHPIHTDIEIMPGQYYEGDEVPGKSGDEDDIIAFDMITNVSLIQGIDIRDQRYRISVRRFRCADMIRPKMYKNWSWP